MVGKMQIVKHNIIPSYSGFPCAADDEPSFGELATQINFALKTCFGDLAVDVIAEPGR